VTITESFTLYLPAKLRANRAIQCEDINKTVHDVCPPQCISALYTKSESSRLLYTVDLSTPSY